MSEKGKLGGGKLKLKGKGSGKLGVVTRRVQITEHADLLLLGIETGLLPKNQTVDNVWKN